MFHTLPHKVVAPAVPLNLLGNPAADKPAVDVRAMRSLCLGYTAHGEAVYRAEYARLAPLYRQRWANAAVLALDHAKADILAAMLACGGDPAYDAKLYAELDAVRDRENDIRLYNALPRKARRNRAI